MDVDSTLENATPTVWRVSAGGGADYDLGGSAASAAAASDGGARQPVDAAEVFALLRHLNDPEHPLTLEQLHVVTEEACTVDDAAGVVDVAFTPTIPVRAARALGECRGERRARARAASGRGEHRPLLLLPSLSPLRPTSTAPWRR